MTQSQDSTNQPTPQEQESPKSSLNRREFIVAGAAAASALVIPKSAQANPGLSKGGTLLAQAPQTCPPSLTKPSDKSFSQPKIIYSEQTGDYCTLTSTLNVVEKSYSDQTPPADTFVRAFQEEGAEDTPALAPGPTLCVNPGDKIQLLIDNQLTSEADCLSGHDDTKLNQPNCFNTINMHFHGLHVSPMSQTDTGEIVSSGDPNVNLEDIAISSDDVLYELYPSKNHSYSVWLPAFHAPGTHWYHAHRHGSTAIQVAGGMVGALIVKEPAGQDICPGAPDVVMVIQEAPQSTTGQSTAQENQDFGIYNRPGNSKTGTFLVNGKGLDNQGNLETPKLTLQKGEIQRWRLINANSTPRAFINLELHKGTSATGELQTLYRVAVDGITLYGKQMDNPSVKLTEAVPFAPGNRVDFLVKLEPGTYTLWKKADTDNAPASKPDQALATIEVDGSTTFKDAAKVAASFKKLIKEGIPNTGKPNYLSPINKFDKNATPVVFQASPGNFQITNGKYDPSNLANIEADLNSSQEWIVANIKQPTAGAKKGASHPFHIHVNPFLVVETATIDPNTVTRINAITGNTPEDQQQIYELLDGLTTWTSDGIDTTIWWDTFTIPNNKAYKIRHRFDDYWGTYVLHCHILIHEDQGMMWNVNINNLNNSGANPCQQLLSPVILTGTKIALQADTGKWFSRCRNCQRTVGNRFPDTITVHIDNPTNKPYAQFEVKNMGNGKIALKADTGKYVARCRGCIVNGAYPDFVTVHVDDPSATYAQFTPETLPNGKIALKADTGKYVSRCRNCSPGAAYPDQVTIHVDDPTNAPYAQWTIDYM